MSCGGEAHEIFARAGDLMQGRTPAVDAIASSDYPTPAKRPRNSVLSNARLKERFGLALPSWEAEWGNVLARLTAEAQTAAAKAL